MALRLSGQTSKFGGVFFVFKSPLRIERQKKLKKFTILTRRPRSHVRVLIYRTWPIQPSKNLCQLRSVNTGEHFLPLSLPSRLFSEHEQICGKKLRMRYLVSVTYELPESSPFRRRNFPFRKQAMPFSQHLNNFLTLNQFLISLLN